MNYADGIKCATLFTVISAVMTFTALETAARKKGFKLSAKASKTETVVIRQASAADTVMTPYIMDGSFMVTSKCDSCNNGYSLDQVVFTGFDKKQNSSKESFFIINNTDRELTGVALHIDYRTLDGRQLHKQFLTLRCSIPPGETRKTDIPTWDAQRSFYYHKSQPAKKGGNPFDVRFHPIACYLHF